jgi:hypothetical protein
MMPAHLQNASFNSRDSTMKLMTVDLTHEDGIEYAAWSNTGVVAPALAIDALVRVLAHSRASMEPAVPGALPMLVKEPAHVDSPAWQWSMEADGTLRLNLRHPGLGWLSFRMPNAAAFRDDLQVVIGERDALRAELDPPGGG